MIFKYFLAGCPYKYINKVLLFSTIFTANLPLLSQEAVSCDAVTVDDEIKGNQNPNLFLPDEYRGGTVILDRPFDNHDAEYYIELFHQEAERQGYSVQTNSQNKNKKYFELMAHVKKNIFSSEVCAHYLIKTRSNDQREGNQNIGTMELDYHKSPSKAGALIPLKLRTELVYQNALNVNLMFSDISEQNWRDRVSALNSLIGITLNYPSAYGKTRILTSFVQREDVTSVKLFEWFGFKKVALEPVVVAALKPEAFMELEKRDFYVKKYCQNDVIPSSSFLLESISREGIILERSSTSDVDFIAHLYNDDELLKNQGLTRKRPVIKVKEEQRSFYSDASFFHKVYNFENPFFTQVQLDRIQKQLDSRKSLAQKRNRVNLVVPPNAMRDYHEAKVRVRNYVIPSTVYLSYTVKDQKTRVSLGYMQVGYLMFCPNALRQIPSQFHNEIEAKNAMKVSIMMHPAYRTLAKETNAFKTIIDYIQFNQPLSKSMGGEVKMLTSLIYPKDQITLHALVNCGFVDCEPGKSPKERHLFSRYL